MVNSTILKPVAVLLISLWGCDQRTSEIARVAAAAEITFSDSYDNYGFGDSTMVVKGVIEQNDFLSTLLARHGVSALTVEKVADASKDVFDVRKFQAGKNYAIHITPDSVAQRFIYEIDAIRYVVYDFSSADSVVAYQSEKDVKLVSRSGVGTVTGALWNDFASAGLNPILALALSDVFAWSIDFYRLQEADEFKIIYNERFVEGESAGPGDIISCWMRHNGEEYYAFRFQQDSVPDYFNDSAHSLRKAFLIAPVQYSRVASRYTKSRFHPILRYHRPHLGTDYSAPHGTPIWATGNGTVIEAQYRGGNGNYVKIRHNSTYQTQYLHMSRFAKGIKPGVTVKQGDVIGYVGSTGLSTGPHVCYRFWKNGEQVDHLREKFPPAEPVKEEFMTSFVKVRDSMKHKLDAMSIVLP